MKSFHSGALVMLLGQGDPAAQNVGAQSKLSRSLYLQSSGVLVLASQMSGFWTSGVNSQRSGSLCRDEKLPGLGHLRN